MRLPTPVLSRSISAESTPVYAYMPAAISAMEQPALAISVSPGPPVTERKPPSDWISRS